MSFKKLFQQFIRIRDLHRQQRIHYYKFGISKHYFTATKFKNWSSKYIFGLRGGSSFSLIIAFTQNNLTSDKIPENKKVLLIQKQQQYQKQRIAMTEQQKQELKHILDHADQLFDENHFQEVYDTLIKYEDQSLPEINWRKARTLFQLSKTIKDKNERNKLIEQSNDLIHQAYNIDENNFAIHKWLAIIMDAHAEIDGIKSRIQKLNTIKYHMEKAIELNPDDPTSWYLLGAFEFGLADLPWIQRKIVSTVFAEPPSGSYDKALEYFQKAEKIKEGFYSTNWLMMGKCYYALKDYENAKIFFEKASNCRVLNEDDKNCKEEAQKLFKKL